MTWGIFKHDAVSEAYTKMKTEELKGNQKKLDKNKNGKLDSDDFKKLRNEDYDDETAVDKSKIPAYLRKDNKLTLKDLDKERTKNRSHPETILKINGTQKEETEVEAEQLDEISSDLAASYKDKATTSMNRAQGAADTHARHYANNHKDSSLASHQKFAAKVDKRKAGIDAANKRIKEDVEELVEYESKDGVYKHQAKAGRYGGTEKESDYVKGPSDAALKKIEAEKKKPKNEGLDIFSEKEIDTLINEVLSKNASAGEWISDFVKSDNPKFAGKSKEQRKKQALAAYYAAQRNESTDYDSFLSEEGIIKGAKEIKHANMKDKQDDQEVMEPHSGTEQKFLDAHTVIVTDEPNKDGTPTGADKAKRATEPKGKGPGSYDAKEKLGNQKTGIKEDIVKIGRTATGEEGEVVDTAPQADKKDKKTFRQLKGNKKAADYDSHES
jgi:hypothetical protein